MLYVLSGDDFVKIKSRAAEITKGCETVRFGEGGEPLSDAPSRLNGAGLFSAKIALFLDKPLETAEGKELFFENAEAFAESDTVVVLTAVDVDAATQKKLPKKAKVEFYDVPRVSAEPAPNIFQLADAFAKGDRKTAWVLYRRFIENGTSPEEIHGTLSWQARALVLASKTKSATEAGLKPFAYTKAKSALAKVKNPDALSRELVSLYHKARTGQGSLEDLLEMFLLKKA